MRKVFLAGATGSIGLNTLKCIDYLNHHYQKKPEQQFELVGISARSNLEEIKKILRKYPIKFLAISSETHLNEIKKDFSKNKDGNAIQFFVKSEEAIGSTHFDILVNALSGSAGLLSTVKAITKQAKILLANKESLVMAGHLINQQLREQNTKLIPIDSEHSAIFLMLRNYQPTEINRLIITASGGPFLKKNISNPSIEDALNHPNWKMGKKITIDSATMMNKGLEVIEAHYLFDFPYDKIDTIIHPQSIVHSIVETVDGEQYAQIGSADMCHPIQNALTYPEILPNPLKKFDLFNHSPLEFHAPDLDKFPMLRIAYECGKKGGCYPMVMNAANEEAVYGFLEGKLTFNQIIETVEKEVGNHQQSQDLNIDEIITLDTEIKEKVRSSF